MNSSATNRTDVSFYRRLYVAYLIANGTNTVPGLLKATVSPKRTLEDTLVGLARWSVVIGSRNGTKNLQYYIIDPGPINLKWVENNLSFVRGILGLH